jgi:hypothetical protein
MRQAQQLKTNPLITEAMEEVEKECFSAFKASKSPAEREDIYGKLRGLQHFRSKLNGIIDRTLRDERDQSADE